MQQHAQDAICGGRYDTDLSSPSLAETQHEPARKVKGRYTESVDGDDVEDVGEEDGEEAEELEE